MLRQDLLRMNINLIRMRTIGLLILKNREVTSYLIAIKVLRVLKLFTFAGENSGKYKCPENIINNLVLNNL